MIGIIETGPVWIETFLNKNVSYHNNCVTFYLENTISEKWVLYRNNTESAGEFIEINRSADTDNMACFQI